MRHNTIHQSLSGNSPNENPPELGLASLPSSCISSLDAHGATYPKEKPAVLVLDVLSGNEPLS